MVSPGMVTATRLVSSESWPFVIVDIIRISFRLLPRVVHTSLKLACQYALISFIACFFRKLEHLIYSNLSNRFDRCVFCNYWDCRKTNTLWKTQKKNLHCKPLRTRMQETAISTYDHIKIGTMVVFPFVKPLSPSYRL